MVHTIEQEKSYFDRQLLLNKKELNYIARRPPHWNNLISDVGFFVEQNENIDTIRANDQGSWVAPVGRLM